MPALFDHLRHPPRLSAGFHCHPAARNVCEIRPEVFLFHPQPELLAYLTALIQNANVAVLISQIDSDIKTEVLSLFCLSLLLLCFLLLLVSFLIAGLLSAPRVRLNWEPNASRRETAFSSHLRRAVLVWLTAGVNFVLPQCARGK